jgi:hypothetical protein
VATLGLLVAGCDARFTADLATDPPADPGIVAVQVNLLGLEFRRNDGSTPTLEFRTGELVDLLDLRDGDPLRLFTDEQLPAGQYTGVRLLFDDDDGDNAVTTGDGEFPLLLVEGSFAAVDFSVEDEEDSRETLSLVLDLRQSLDFDGAVDEYALTPRLRVVRTDEAARIEGTVAVTCPLGTSLAEGGAIYLFAGTDVLPDDLDGANAEPLATTGVVDSGVAGFQYALRFLPAGDYTLALTCRGNEEALGVDDDLDFGNVGNVEVGEGDAVRRDLD